MKNQMLKNRHGWVLLIMLLVIVVLGGLFTVKPSALWGPKAASMDLSGELLPWMEENRLVKRDQPINMPASGKPSVEKPLMYKSDAAESNEPRGEIALIIDPDGRVSGNWSGDFRQGDIVFSILSGGFAGNIDASKIFRDKSGQDPSRLFFITRGSFVLLGDNRKTNDAPQKKGLIYVTGWIGPDYKATGKVTLTGDKTTYKTYTWRCNVPRDRMF